MNSNSFVAGLMARGIGSDLAHRIETHFGDWVTLSAANLALLANHFTEEEVDAIRRAKARREIPRETIIRLVDECEWKCCLCWNSDSDAGVVIHHIHPHASQPDDSYENLIVLCADHHSKVHTRWELTRHPYPPELLLRRKGAFTAAIAAFKAGKRVAPGRERSITPGVLISPPLPPPHFVGRDTLAWEIARALRLRPSRVAVIGMGGVGKTALALKVADSCRESFPGGILWGEIAADSGGVPEILRSWIRSLGQNASGLQITEQFALFADLLTSRATASGRVLLMFDDANERVTKEMVELLSYLPADVSALITTRETTVAAALAATQFRIEPLERLSCRQLLESISGSPLVRTDEDAGNRLLSLLGDLPLAVELVARQIAVRERKPGFSIAGLCRQLEDFDSDILSFPGHRGIAISFALSYDNLDENEKRVFRSFGVFAHAPLDTTSVAAVADATDESTERLLDRLVTVSMLNWGNGLGDYRIHPLLHKYAEFLFNRSNATERRSVRLRFYHHFTSSARASSKDTRNNLEAIDRILPHLIKAIGYASADGDHPVVSETVLGLCVEMSFFTSRNLDRESIPLLEMAISATERLGDRNGESAFLGHLGTAYSRLGMLGEAIAHYERAIAIAKKMGNDYDLASHLQNLGGTLLSESQDLPRAERLLHDALDAAKRARNPDVVIGCLSSLGSLHRRVGNLSEAARLYSGAIEASKVAENRLAEGNNLSNLGLIMIDRGNDVPGERMIREALGIAVEVGDRRGEGNRTGHLGRLFFERATRLAPGPEQTTMLEIAREHTMTAMRIAQETGDTEKATCWTMNLGLVLSAEGKLAEATKELERALEASKAGGFAMLEAQTHFNLGTTLALQNQLDLAITHLASSSVLLRRMGSPLASHAKAYVERLNEMKSRAVG
jgi:tetratricopeptide (TPR) repeat protein